MAENIDDLHRRIKELETQVAVLHNQLKDDGRFGLKWIDVPEAFDKESENKIPILEEVPKLAITNDDGKPTHILIEGDNYHAFTCLNYTHRGKVDVIYIDPPYNTGSDGFTYKDKRFLEKYPDGAKVPTNHPLRHSSWISFMKKRLELSKDILKDDGVIFISIGSDELSNLIQLCNSIFEERFNLGIISRVQKKGSDKGTYFSPAIDYVLAFTKGKKKPARFFEPVSANFPLIETEGIHKGEYYEASKSLYQSSLDSRPNQRYYILCPDGSYVIPPGNVFPKTISDGSYVKPINNEDKCWRWAWDQYLLKKDRLVFKKTTKSPLVNEKGKPSKWNVYTKRYRFEAEEKGNVPANTIDDCINTLGTNRLSALGLDFSFAKPCELIKKLVSFTNKPKDITILDFFAGSGTTMDAIMQMNNQDGGKRQVILVQYPEPTFEIKKGMEIPIKGCESLYNQGLRNLAIAARERNRRVIDGYDGQSIVNTELYSSKINLTLLKRGNEVIENLMKLKEVEASSFDEVKLDVKDGCITLKGKKKASCPLPPLGNSLKYYRTAFVGSNPSNHATDDDKTILAQKAGCLLALAENTLYETVKTDNYQIFKDKNRDVWTAVYFKEDYRPKFFDEFVTAVKSLQGTKNIYIFSWGDVGSFESYFDNDPHAYIKGIPQPILDIYKTLNS